VIQCSAHQRYLNWVLQETTEQTKR
jgi:hypothetical protein